MEFPGHGIQAAGLKKQISRIMVGDPRWVWGGGRSRIPEIQSAEPQKQIGRGLPDVSKSYSLGHGNLFLWPALPTNPEFEPDSMVKYSIRG